MSFLARILYENHRKEDKGFMLHDLVCAFVADALGELVHGIKRHVDGVPRDGVDRLLADCGDDVEDMFKGLGPDQRFALVDGDEIDSRLKIAAAASMEERRKALVAQYPAVQMFVIDADRPRDSNTEGLVKVVARCAGVPESDRSLKNALGKRKAATSDRDLILKKAAYGSRAVRDCIRAAQPAIAALVDVLAAVLRAQRA